MNCEHSDKHWFHRGEEIFEACYRCGDQELGRPEYLQECPHCGALIGVN